MGGTACASTNPIHVLVAFRRVLSKIDASAKHASNVGVTLVKALVDDGVDEGRTWHEKCFKVRKKFHTPARTHKSLLADLQCTDMSHYPFLIVQAVEIP